MAEKEVVGIIKDEKALNNTIDDLWDAGFGMHEISVQGDPEQLQDALGEPFVDPKLIADNPKAPRKSPSMPEEFGWLLGFSVAIPLFIGIILGTILATGVSATPANLLQGLAGGAFVGILVGIALGLTIKSRHDRRIIKQMKAGGFVIWVNTDTPDKIDAAKVILQQDGASNVHELIYHK